MDKQQEQKDEQVNEEGKKVIRYKLEKHKWPDEIDAEKARRNRVFLTIGICIVCFVIGFLSNNLVSQSSTSDKQFEKLEKIYGIMANNWYFGKDVEELDDALMNGAINGMVSNRLDIHTSFMDADESNTFISSLEGSFVGIGIQYYAVDDETALVDRVFKGSGAEAGGMSKGDIILSVDGVACKGKTLDEISAMIKGEEGTTVDIVVLRENKEVPLTITRSVVNDSVFGYEKDTTGVLEINTFAETSGSETGKYLKDFQAKGIKNLVIDLRDNGGGYLEAALKIGSYLVPKDSVIYQEQTKKGDIKSTKAYDDQERYEFEKIVILINKDTASASEVLTSCLREQLDNVQVVGVNSYGKGTVQQPIKFEDGSTLKYTVAEWLTPQGNHINGVGIKPDFEVELDKAITTGVTSLEDDEVYQADSVSPVAKSVQIYLKFLGYQVDREDEYFSFTSSASLKAYQSKMGLVASGEINQATIKSLLSSCALEWHRNQEQLDVQMSQALSLLK